MLSTKGQERVEGAVLGFLGVFNQVLNVTGPVFILVIIGLLLRRARLINEHFVQQASNLVFKGTMPVMIAVGLMRTDINTAFDPQAGILFTLLSVASFIFTWVWARWRVATRADRGVYVQGAFRSNVGMVGLALVVNLYGSAGLGLASFLLALHAFIFNIMSILVLSYYSSTLRLNFFKVFADISRNPLILAVVVGILLNLANIRFTPWIENSLATFGSLTLTLGLMVVGGSLSLSGLRESGRLVISATLLKLVWIPLVSALALVALGIDGMILGALVIFLASPTATASVVMVRAANGNASLAAGVVVLTTLGAIITIPVGLLLLQYLQLI